MGGLGMDDLKFSFFEALRYYYENNRGKIRRNYKDLTKKYLDYNDKNINPDAFLRRPQFEALEMYVFVKEFMQNEQMYKIFDDWYKKSGQFSDASYYAVDGGQVTLFDVRADLSKEVFKFMKKNSEAYPNYIFALTMGLGKTILMATCIFYEFLLANKYPKDKRFCHNALVFAPDKTVLQSLKEIQTFNKSLVIPPEYARVLDSNIKFHFLDDTGITLNTLDNSDFNIIISNTQKIILKKQHKEPSASDKLFKVSKVINNSPLGGVMGDLYDFDELENEGELLLNQRFEKLTRLQQLGIFVDEAHHMFGKELEKSQSKNSTKTSLRNTINELAKSLEQKCTHVVACYNYTGTPYVRNIVLPEVVYSYGLSDAINKRYLKAVTIRGYENVKSEEFLRDTITNFWDNYKDSSYEGLLPKLAIFGARIEEITDEIQPTVEKILGELGIPLSKILINVGNEKVTKDEDIRKFNNLDDKGTEGSSKQFILLVNKGREGWNCRSLFGVALFRSPKSKVFVLQATMRCLRKITDVQQNATVYLSKENMDILDNELQQNFRVSLKDINKKSTDKKVPVKVKPTPPPRKIKLKRIRHNYSLEDKGYSTPINFNLDDINYERYDAVLYEKKNITNPTMVKVANINQVKEKIRFSRLTLTSEIAIYLNIKCLLVNKILEEAIDGYDKIEEKVNQYNAILYDVIIPKIFNNLYNVNYTIQSEEKEVILLKHPKKDECYEFNADPDLVIGMNDEEVEEYRDKSFHADNYCFDSKPEKELFWQYIMSDKVKEIFFTGMFTSEQNGLYIQYADPETKRVRKYYPDFIAKMEDDTYEIIEVKGDNKIDDEVVKAKALAAEELATESKMFYKMYAGSKIMKENII